MSRNTITGKPAKLLILAKESILAEPTQFDMKVWVVNSKHSTCGTASCIAGWIAYIIDPDTYFDESANFNELYLTATRAMGKYSHLSFKLFLVEIWPSEFESKFKLAKTYKQRAEVAANRIDYFIKTGN